MKTFSNPKNNYTRAAMLLLMVLAMTLTASATDFITDVMVAGNKDESDFNTLIGNLTQQGWTDINQDLNAGAGGHYIHLLYKIQTSQGNSGTPITDFYIKTGEENPAATVENDGRIYYLVPCQGSDLFVEGQGDLNEGCSQNSDYIHLYYTKDALSNNTGITAITFNTTQSGAVGENGGSTGYDLNSGAHGNYIYMHLTSTSGANVVTLSSGSGEVQLQNGHILTGTGGADTHVTIADGATVTLSGVNITAITNNDGFQWAGLTCLGNAVIVLNGKTTNTVKGGFRSSGIYVPQNKTLTLQGSGILNVTGDQYAAGIGGSYGSSCGNITISDGIVTATGGDSGAGIGGSYGSSCGNIVISGGTVMATGGESAAGVGSGNNHSSCGDIYISVNVTANGGNGASGIGSGYNYSSCNNITINDGIVRAYGGQSATGIGSGFLYSECNNITINGGSVSATGGDEGAGIGSGKYYSSCGTVTISGGTVTALGGDKGAGIGSGFYYSECDNITISDGNVTTIGGNNGAGIGSGLLSSCHDIIVSSSGDITADGGNNGAGIGSGSKGSCLNLTISGVDVSANGGQYASGIGSGFDSSSCGNITISGGTITATGGSDASGIGSGYDSSSCGTVTITNGVNRVTTAKGENCNNAIGAGNHNSTCGTVTIGGIETGYITQSPFVTFPYTVAFDANGGTNSMANQRFMYNVAQNLTPNSFTRTYYEFEGWATSANGPKVYNDEENVINLAHFSGATVTLYAKWSPLPITLTKDIGGYGTSIGGWYLIASPLAESFTPTAGNGFLANAYDLYRFNQAAELEWENWKAEETDNYHFNLESGRGYLYASQENTTLVFSGTPYTGNGEVALNYSTANSSENMRGWNLIGNPFSTTANLPSDLSYYTLNGDRTELTPGTATTIEAMEAIFVKATAPGQSVTFNQATRATNTSQQENQRIILDLSHGGTVIDRAIIRFDEGQPLPKYQIHDNSTKVYIPQDGKNYAVINATGTDEIPVNFKAENNGTYTLTVSGTFHSPLSTFHLIDNLTGADIDLLATPSYTFTAKTNDYASRFKLVFSIQPNGDETDHDPFAFFSNGNIVINGEGILQVIDMVGRQLFNHKVNSSLLIPNSSLTAGIYVLRLINGNEIKNQKILIP